MWLSCIIKVFFVDAQTLDATTRLTNIKFTADLQNTSSQAYINLSESIIEEVSIQWLNVMCKWKYFSLLTCFLCHQPDLPVSVSRGESQGGFRPGQDRDQKLFPGERDGQLHHSVYPKSKPGHKQCVHSSSAVPEEQLDIHSRSKQHKSKWFVSLYAHSNAAGS